MQAKQRYINNAMKKNCRFTHTIGEINASVISIKPHISENIYKHIAKIFLIFRCRIEIFSLDSRRILCNIFLLSL